MHNRDKYHEFVTKFLHLAGEVKIVKEDYKTDFNDKLFFDLQRMMAVVNTIINTYAEFQKICAQAAHTLQTINVTQKSKSLQRNEFNIFKQNTLTLATKSPIIKKALSACPDIQCYYCKEKDHIVRNCPVKQKSQQMITELTENDTSKPSADLKKELHIDSKPLSEWSEILECSPAGDGPRPVLCHPGMKVMTESMLKIVSQSILKHPDPKSEHQADVKQREIKLDKEIRQEHQAQLCRLKGTSSVMTPKTRQRLT
ncbi:hypothetical protein PAAG_00199 [Paracoccidioides lutzii Pb01]|uniref:CCHC-type domain-containing protein n=1 Tax=Paracoccidioides lutzii (strain ATCC MYA-826 / Pb01) TaxID=502779 RepID=C1GNV4_PARBA|nr:hypothetical protein PAAG_00199 [Paracoccidioides lutzii Pb01]EEH35876.2 hypothetical protein PAAG_00199 [Paracoccidioides lutzii Pb01]